jgi:hypothetical protein
MNITEIRGKDPALGLSLHLSSSPRIASLTTFSKLAGALLGGLVITNMENLTALDGLEGITSIGTDASKTMIVLDSNPVLRSTLALAAPVLLHNISIVNNPKLACSPDTWPFADKEGRRIQAPGTMCYER